MKTVYTIGYEGASLSDFVDTLKRAVVSSLLDVRELPQSRRPGFSKGTLSAALREANISYRHIKQLGDPKAGRDAARRGAIDDFRLIYSKHLDLEESQTALTEVVEKAFIETTALMCYEKIYHGCHRSLITDRLVERGLFRVVHLGVQAEGKVKGE